MLVVHLLRATRGSFGEMTGAPDITAHIETVAGDLVADRPASD